MSNSGTYIHYYGEMGENTYSTLLTFLQVFDLFLELSQSLLVRHTRRHFVLLFLLLALQKYLLLGHRLPISHKLLRCKS